MTTFAEMRKFNSFQDFSFDLVCELIGDFKIRGKALDPKTEPPAKLFNRVDWLVNRVGRVLNVSGKLDPEKTTFRIDRDDNKIVHIRFIDLDGNTLYTLDFNGEIVDGERVNRFILTNDKGEVVLNTEKWTGVRQFFAPPVNDTTAKVEEETTDSDEEEVVAEAARKVEKKASKTKKAAKKTNAKTAEATA